MKVKQWFLDKNFNGSEAYSISVSTIRIVKETEKRYQLRARSDYGNITFWCPKSCTMSDDEYYAERKAAAEKFDNACERYAQLKEFAIANGVKGVREFTRKETLLKKMSDELKAEAKAKGLL